MSEKTDKTNYLEVVNVRLVKEPSLYSTKKIKSPKDAIDVMADELKTYDREVFAILNLKNTSEVINMNIVSVGTLDSSLVSPRELFKSSILANAKAFIALHNHPSGEITPSSEDIQVTQRLQECGRILDIPLIDHIIVGGETGKMYSFRAEDNIVREPQMVYREEKTMNKNDANKNLGKKMIEELNAHYDKMAKLPSIEVLNASEETVFKSQLIETVLNNPLETNRAEVMLNCDSVLDVCYAKWLKADYGFDSNTLHSIIDEEADFMLNRENREKPLEKAAKEKEAESEKGKGIVKYLNIYKSYAKIDEPKRDGTGTYNQVTLPKGVIVDGKDLSGGKIYPKDKFIYPSKFNPDTMVTVQYLDKQNVRVNLKDGDFEIVTGEKLTSAVEAANKAYLEENKDKAAESKDKEHKKAANKTKEQEDEMSI